MSGFRSLTSKVVVSTVLVGLLLTGVAGSAGAARKTGSTVVTHKEATKAAHAVAVAEGHFSCTNATQAVNSVQELKSKFAQRLADLEAAQTRVQTKATTITDPRRKAFQNYLAAFYGRRIAKTKKYEAHVLSSHFLARVARISKLAKTKCP